MNLKNEKRLQFCCMILLLLTISFIFVAAAYPQKAVRGNGVGASKSALADTAAAIRAAAGTGDITAVVAGDGLKGGASSGSATVDMNFKLTGNGRITASSDSTHIVAETIPLNDLSNVDVSGASSGQVIMLNGSVWRDTTLSAGATALDGLTDVDITGAATSNLLMRRTSGIWVDTTVSAISPFTAAGGVISQSTASDVVTVYNNMTIQDGSGDTNPAIELRVDTANNPRITFTGDAYINFDDPNNQLELNAGVGVSPSINVEDNMILSNAGGSAWGLFCMTSSGTTSWYQTNASNGETTSDGLKVDYSGTSTNGAWKVDNQETNGSIELATGGGLFFVDVGDNGTDELSVASNGVIVHSNAAGSYLITIVGTDTASYTSANAFKFDNPVILNNGLILRDGTIEESAVSAGSNSFTTTATTDTVTISGAANTDLYIVTLTGAAAPLATDAVRLEKLSTGFVLHRSAAGTSGLTYDWFRRKP